MTISNLHVTIGDKPILNSLTLDVPAGEVHTIVGPNTVGMWYVTDRGEQG